MNWFSYLERLRNEPESHRKRTALITAFSLAGIIFLGWFMAVSGGSSVSYSQESASASSSPIAAVGDAVKTGANLLGELLDTFKQTKAIIFEAASSTATSTVR